LTFNKTDDANRVQDILTALAWLRLADDEKSDRLPTPPHRPRESLRLVSLRGRGFRATPSISRPTLAASPARNQDYIDGFFVPGIQRAGGLRAAASWPMPGNGCALSINHMKRVLMLAAVAVGWLLGAAGHA